jgi:glycosyltransferase involved in cell wall biosynthesis
MKVGVYLPNIASTVGGELTFQDDILQALIKLESKHTFVIFSNLARDQIRELSATHLQFVSSRHGFTERARLARFKWLHADSQGAQMRGVVRAPHRTLARTVAKAVARLPLIRNWSQIARTNWLKQAVDDFGIEMMWFVTPGYIEVDIPYIFTIWDLQHRLQPWFPDVSANGQWHRREEIYATAIPRASAIIVGTETGKADIVHFYRVPPERVRLVPHPTPRFALNALKGNDKRILTEYHIPEGYLFYPAQFWPHKNHVGLLQAVRLLRERDDLIFPVVLVGSDKGNLQYVRRVVDRLNLSNQVHFLGFVPQNDLVELYRHAFALTYLTFFGPENLPPLEAFAMGCPVVASNVSGAQEQLGDAALLVDPKDEEQIALAIKSLYKDPLLRQALVQRGLERATSWTGDDFVESICSILDEFEPVRRCWSNTEPYRAVQ